VSEVWFLLDDRGRMGPFTYTELTQTVATYPDPAEVLVKREGQKSWQRAGDISGLLEKSTPIAPEIKIEKIVHEPVDPPSTGAKRLPAAQRWVKWGAILGFIIGAINVFTELSDGKLQRDNGAYLLAIVIGSACVVAAIAAVGGAIADWMSRPKKLISNLTVSDSVRTGSHWNIVTAHWRGEFPLWISYWVINFCVSIAATVVVVLVVAAFEPKSGYDPVLGFASISTSWLCIVVIIVWQIVGLWRSANKHIARRTAIGKTSPWAGLAKLAAIVMAIKLGATFVQSGLPQITEGVRIAFLGDPEIPAYSFRIMRNGTEVEIDGGFKYGMTDDFKKLLAASRQIRVVHLDSLGGRIGEAEKLYNVIRSHGLTTYVASECASACTLAFAAGRQRYIAPNAILGFHAPWFPGMGKSDLASNVADQSKLFIQAGFAPSFVNHALSTPSSDLWKPTIAELYASHAITGVTNGTEFALSGFGNVTKPQIGEMLSKTIPLLNALHEKFPKSYQSIIDVFYSSYLEGDTQAEAIITARKKLFAIMNVLKRSADDAVLRDMAQWYADAYETLGAKNPTACYKFASGLTDQEVGLPSKLVESEAMLGVRIVETAAVRTPPDNSTTADVWRKLRLLLKIYNISGPDLDLIMGSTPISRDKYGEYCQASVGFYRAIAALPPRDAAIAMRKVFSTNESVNASATH
jgi:GYF domain 2